MNSLDLISNNETVAALAARREALFDAGAGPLGDLTYEQEGEAEALGAAIMAGNAVTLSDAAAQLVLIGERMDLIEAEAEMPSGDVQNMWNEIRAALRSALPVVKAAAGN